GPMGPRALLHGVGQVAVVGDEDVGLALVAAGAVWRPPGDDDAVERMQLAGFAADPLAHGEVTAVPDPRAPQLHAIAVRRPGEERQRAALPLEMQPAELLAVRGLTARVVARPLRRAATEEVAGLPVGDEVRVEVVPLVLPGGV